MINAADDSMLTQKSVHIVITAGHGQPPASQRIVADIGTVTGAETITDGTATRAIRITSKAAYFTGDPAGLTAYIGLSAQAAGQGRRPAGS